MTRTHFSVEILYDTTWGPACGYDAPGELTDDPAKVDCPKCIKLCGFETIEPARHVLTDRIIRRAA